MEMYQWSNDVMICIFCGVIDGDYMKNYHYRLKEKYRHSLLVSKPWLFGVKVFEIINCLDVTTYTIIIIIS